MRLLTGKCSWITGMKRNKDLYIINTEDDTLVQIKEEYSDLKEATDRLVELLSTGYTKVHLHNTALEND